jgi:galactokinase
MSENLDTAGLISLFEEVFESKPELLVRAAGRVNLIGEHTDYNDGFVLPAAIDRFIYFIVSRREDRRVVAYAADFQQKSSFTLEDGERDPEYPWNIYLKGVIQLLRQRGFQLGGANIFITATLPRASGLSSSAAMEVATASAFQALYPFEIDEIELIKLIQRAEHQYAGTKCGIMDMFVCRMGERDHALFLDCRSHNYRLVPSDMSDLAMLICDSKKKRGLATSAYNERRAQCEEGVKLLGAYIPAIRALRDVSPEDFEKYAQMLPAIVRSRCAHVIYENERVLKAIEALQKNDLRTLGELMAGSHESLRDLYQVSCDELDTLVDAANQVSGTVGARMTGAGFGGCTVNLVRKNAIENFTECVRSSYTAKFGLIPDIYVCRAEQGVLTEWLQ